MQPTRGDVLLTIVGTIGRAAVLDEDPRAVFQRSVAVLRPDPAALDSRYLFHATQSSSFRGQLSRATNQSSQAGVYLSKLREIEIELPTLAEQRQIAAILDQADALRVRRRRVLSHVDTITSSVFLDMFGKFTGKFLTVQEVAAPEKGSIRTGPFGSQLLHEEFVDEGIAVLGLDNVVGNQFSWKQRRFITPEKYDQLRRYTVQPGDVLVSIMGTCGRCVVVPADVGTAINTKHICAITLDRNLVVPEFVRAAFLWHSRARQHLTQRAKGSIMDGLNMGIIKEMPLPVPQLEDQRAFVAASNQIQTLSQAALESSGKLDELFKSLQGRAFSGQL